MPAEPRHGCLNEFLALTVAAVARTLRCCSRSIRSYIAGRSPIPWHRIEVLRLLALEAAAASGGARGTMPVDEPAVVANIDPDPAARDVPPAELLAWVGVHAPHFLSSRRSFALYVRGWHVIDKIRPHTYTRNQRRDVSGKFATDPESTQPTAPGQETSPRVA